MISTRQTATPPDPNEVKTGHVPQARQGAKMSSTRKIALVAGVLFLITFITSIPAQLILYHPLLTDPAKYILVPALTRPCPWVRSWKSSL